MKNFELKAVKLHLKTDLVSYPARAEGLLNIYYSCFVSMAPCTGVKAPAIMFSVAKYI